MQPIAVIADDLTGAAEIAGVGLRHGMRVELVPDSGTLATIPDAPLVVINTDSRGLPSAEAAARVTAVAPLLPEGRVYKKIDSVLRGPVLAEAEAALAAMPRYRRALLVPQNPSRGRTIEADGTYRVDGVPLDRTAFAHDPDHPAATANAFERLGRSARVTIGPAATLDEVRAHAATLADDVLPVGSADFFQAMLEREGHRPTPAPAVAAWAARTLFVSGTAAPATRGKLVAEMRTRDAPCAELPIAWFVGDPPSRHVVADWSRRFADVPLAAVLAPVERCEPARVHALLCDAAATLISEPLALYVDGGATAMSLCRRMGWTALDVVAEVGPGAVTLAPSAGVRMTIKPGSYAWPDAVWHVLEGVTP